MRKLNAILLAAAVVLGAMASTDALAHGYRTRVGVYVGAPIGFGYGFGYGYGYAPWYSYPAPYYSPYYYPGPAVGYPSGPTNYVEQAAPEASSAPRSDAFWYYCPEAKAYYPYVNQCAGGWQKVSPKPPS